jgi:hypothetical protein
MKLQWRWPELSGEYANYGNANQWTVGSGLRSLAREATQNSNDAIDQLRSERGEPDERPRIEFRLRNLEGATRTRFLDAFGWAEMRDHLDAMAKGTQIVNRTIRDALAALEDHIVLLQISDHGAAGLDGPEFLNDSPESGYGNFIKLVRSDLFSGKKTASGGSFGLGKAVYWRFSRLQTALFLSNPAQPSQYFMRTIGVNQGTTHWLGEKLFDARGYFGVYDPKAKKIRSTGIDPGTAEALCLTRLGASSGTTAMIVGFYDPDQPDADVETLRSDLEKGIDESFWPLLARDRVDISVAVDDDPPRSVLAEARFPELSNALRRFDAGAVDERLGAAGSVVSRPIKIAVPRRRTEPAHDAFEHTAQLVVTRSDNDSDPLEDSVCFFRRSEMVVQTVRRQIPGVKYHAFLIAGDALRTGDAQENHLADDFLRFAEPPAHDLWIPTSKSPQTSLGLHYVAPYLPSLHAIGAAVTEALDDIFGVEPPPADKGPDAILRHLAFLTGKGGPALPKKPVVEIELARVEADGSWFIEGRVRMRKPLRPLEFDLTAGFAGLEGDGERVRWRNLTVGRDGSLLSGARIVVHPAANAKHSIVTFSGSTDPESHPIPASMSAVRVDVKNVNQVEGGDPE